MVLNKDKRQGGLGVPDIKNYYNAISLSWVLEWVKMNKEKRWVKLENTISNVALGKIIWIPPEYREISENTHVKTKKILAIWDLMHTKETFGYH